MLEKWDSTPKAGFIEGFTTQYWESFILGLTEDLLPWMLTGSANMRTARNPAQDSNTQHKLGNGLFMLEVARGSLSRQR